MPKATPPRLPDLSGLDPSVMAALSDGARRQASASLPRDQRAKQAKAAAKLAGRNRINLDVDPDLQSRLTALATHYGCPLSGLVNLAIYLILLDDQAGELDLTPFLAASNTPRYEHVIKLPSRKTDKPPPRGTPQGHPSFK